jgi:CMP-N-acetylneuraminic acid synthetase
MTFLGLIPARGGSKGVPEKNMRMIAGKPLIVWSIEAAQQSSYLEEIYVSTEDSRIASIAQSCGAKVIVRPPELATDEATTLSVWQHALREIPADTLISLAPTSPIRASNLIDNCIKQFLEKQPHSLATGSIVKSATWNSLDTQGLRRQDMRGFFYDDGSVYVVNAETIKSGSQYGNINEHFLTSREQNIDIDDPFDFWVAEQVLNKIARDKSNGLDELTWIS